MAKLLLVDDAPAVIRAVSRLLGAHGHVVDVAASGEAALASLERSPLPDLVVLDLMMPGIGGAEVLRRLRAAERTRTLPVVILSSGMDAAVRAALLAAGAQACVLKASRDPDELPETIARVLAGGAGGQAT
jgi:CheY-like chemotaxis protein